MTLAYWIKIEVSRASRSLESDLTRFSEKVEASRTASFRGQEIFPMESGDVPRYTHFNFSRHLNATSTTLHLSLDKSLNTAL